MKETFYDIRNILSPYLKFGFLRGKKSVSICLIISFTFSNLVITHAEPFYFLPNLMSQIRVELKKRPVFQEKLDFLDETYKKMQTIETANKKFILSDIKDFNRNFIYSYLREYTQNKYLTGSGVDITIKETRKYYQAVKIKDITADIHPNYLAYLENKIKEKPFLDEESPTYKTYVYILFNYLKYKDHIKETTESKLSSMGNFGSSAEFTQNIDYYKGKFDKFNALEKPNLLSKNDFTRIYSKISSKKISPESDYMKGFLYWYVKYKKALGSNTLMLKQDFGHSKQTYTLSCEANSAKDLINYYNIKDSKTLISEDSILSSIPSFTGALARDGSGSFLWEDPTKMFVGQITGKQSSNANNFTGYGVYADPLISSINISLKPKNLVASKSSVDEKVLLESILNEHPVIFWYLTPVIKGKKMAYETRPTTWKTPSGKNINGYLGEHTGILIGADISKEGNIESVYYFEGKKEELQKMEYSLFLQTTAFFNEIIVVNSAQKNSKKITSR